MTTRRYALTDDQWERMIENLCSQTQAVSSDCNPLLPYALLTFKGAIYLAAAVIWLN